MYTEMRQQLSAQLQRVQTTEAITAIADQFSPKVEATDYFKRFYARAGVAFAKSTFRTLKAASGKWERKDINAEIRNSIFLEKLFKYVEEKCGFKIEATIHNEIADIVSIARAAVSKATAEGWGVDKTVKEMMRSIQQRHEWKAMRIARTEIVSASNYGAYMGAAESGVETEKIWLATGYPGPSGYMREDHLEMNERRVNIDEPFILPDGYEMPFPGEGPAHHVINCRCTVAFEPKGGGLTAQLLGEI